MTEELKKVFDIALTNFGSSTSTDPTFDWLNHWGWMRTYGVTIGRRNSLSHIRHQAIVSTNVDALLIDRSLWDKPSKFKSKYKKTIFRSRPQNGGHFVLVSKYPFPYCIYQQHMPFDLDGIILSACLHRGQCYKAGSGGAACSVSFWKVETGVTISTLTETYMEFSFAPLSKAVLCRNPEMIFQMLGNQRFIRSK